MTARTSKQRVRLDMLEAELLRKLIAQLKIVADGKDTLFFTTAEFNPFDLPQHMLSPVAEELSELSLEAIRLRELLGEPDEQSVGHVFRRALREATDISNHQRLGPIRRAAQLLAALSIYSQRDA